MWLCVLLVTRVSMIVWWRYRADVGEAFLVLFRIATLSGWGDVTFQLTSARSDTQAPGMTTFLSLWPTLSPAAPDRSLVAVRARVSR